jgi:hypothetical protein
MKNKLTNESVAKKGKNTLVAAKDEAHGTGDYEV